MASCSKCGKTVGCSCNLKNGVCGSCMGKSNPHNPVIQPRKPVIPKVHPQAAKVVPKRYNSPVVNKAFWAT